MLIINCSTDIISTDAISTGIRSTCVISTDVISTGVMSNNYLPLYDSAKYMQCTNITYLIICQSMSLQYMY